MKGSRLVVILLVLSIGLPVAVYAQHHRHPRDGEIRVTNETDSQVSIYIWTEKYGKLMWTWKQGLDGFLNNKQLIRIRVSEDDEVAISDWGKTTIREIADFREGAWYISIYQARHELRRSTPSASSGRGKIISLDNDRITFEAPEGFKPLPEEIIKIKYPSSNAPKYVIGNESTGTTIAYDVKPNDISQVKIDELRAGFTEMFPKRIPGLKWKENKIIELSGRKWVYLELTSTAVDTDIYNIMLVTGYKDQTLFFNFNSTKEEFKKYERALRESINSIKIK
jgi:hypothetical protein